MREVDPAGFMTPDEQAMMGECKHRLYKYGYYFLPIQWAFTIVYEVFFVFS